MASLTYDRGKRKATIQFRDARRRRRSIRLSNVAKTFAERFHSAVERLNNAKRTGGGIDNHCASFVNELGDVFYDKLTKVELVEPREKPEQAGESSQVEVSAVVTVGGFLDEFLAKKASVKDSTKTFYGHTLRNLLTFFSADTPLTAVTHGDADDFREFLISKYSEATVNRRCGVAKTIFKSALRHRLISSNPFEDQQTTVRDNKSKRRMISREVTDQILEACPDAEWRLLVALGRYAGMRIPSEAFHLKWSDIDWKNERIRFHVPKTEHRAGHSEREIPLFPELVEPLLDLSDQTGQGSEYVIQKLRSESLRDKAGHFKNASLSTRFKKIIRRAGFEPWPKPFTNLRASRDTELREEFPGHVVEAWIGHGDRIAKEHYLMVTEEHFTRAVSRVVPQMMPPDAVPGSTDPQSRILLVPEDGRNSGQRKKKRSHAETCDRSFLGGTGPEHLAVFNGKTVFAV